MKIKLTVSALCIGLLSTSVMAAGFGVAGQQPQNPPPDAAAINQLLDSANANANANAGADPLQQERAQAVPPAMMTDPTTGQPMPTPSVQPAGQPVGAGAAGVDNPGAISTDSPASQQAFGSTVRNLMPLSPEQIKTLRYMFDQSQRASAAYPGTPPRPTSSTVLVNLSPGATPPIVRLRAGYVSSLVFLDSTGQPWPIMAYDLGDPQAFNIAPNQPDGKSNTLLVQSMDTYKSGNLAVMLKDLNTPIMVTLLPGQRAVDYRMDLRVPGLGPNAQATTGGIPAAVNPQLVNFLDGVPPNGAKTLEVEGGPSQAWSFGSHLFLRTRLTVLSPSWISTMSSPDGTHVYELTKAPVVLASQNGAVIQLTIKGL